MARGELTPLDRKYRRLISNNLVDIAHTKNLKQADIAHESGLAKSTINGYFKGISSPTRKNLLILAKTLHVEPSEIDPRYDYQDQMVSKSEKHTVDLEKVDPKVLSYGGKPVSQEDMEIIKAILQRHQDN